MLFDLLDIFIILFSIAYYLIMGFGFVVDVNKADSCKSSPAVYLVAVVLWPLLMFFRALVEIFEVKE